MINGRRFSHIRNQDRCRRLMVHRKLEQSARRIGLLVVCLTVATSMADFVVAAQRSQPPGDRAVAKVVDEFFSSQPGYQKGDLITQSQIEKVVAKLVSEGVTFKDPGSVVKLGLADDSFLVRELSTPNGKRFMRKIAPRAGAYSHLDRLSTIPRGETTVRELIRQKDGDKMIDYLATTKGGKNMGGMIAQARGGVDLNKPTGRIYTADDLVAALKGAIAKP